MGTYDGGAGAARVDELADGVGVVGEVDGQVLVGLVVGVGGDELLEVVGDGLGLVVGQAGGRVVVARVDLFALDEAEGRGEDGGGEEAGEDGGGTHGVVDVWEEGKCASDGVKKDEVGGLMEGDGRGWAASCGFWDGLVMAEVTNGRRGWQRKLEGAWERVRSEKAGNATGPRRFINGSRRAAAEGGGAARQAAGRSR